MWTYGDSRDAVADALRLSRAMTFKAAVADLPLGGGKGVIMRRAGDPPLGPEQRRAALLDFADTVDMLDGRYRDRRGRRHLRRRHDRDRRGHAPRHRPRRRARRLRRPEPVDRARRPGGRSTSPASACSAATDLGERSIAVVGLGRVGGALARMLAEAGARLVVADVDEGKRALADELGADWTDPDAALLADVDVLAPCALGGVLDDETVPALRCRAIAGAANNQLAAETIAERLTDRGILWAPDFVANAGGIINIAVELEPEGYAPERAEERVRAVGDTLRTIFDDAEAAGTTPLAAAMTLAYRRLAEASDPRTRSFARCAPSVTAAAGRSAGGASAHTASSSSSSPRSPSSSASSSLLLALAAVGDVLVELVQRVATPAARGRGRSRAAGAGAGAAAPRGTRRGPRRRTRCPRRAPRRR